MTLPYSSHISSEIEQDVKIFLSQLNQSQLDQLDAALVILQHEEYYTNRIVQNKRHSDTELNTYRDLDTEEVISEAVKNEKKEFLVKYIQPDAGLYKYYIAPRIEKCNVCFLELSFKKLLEWHTYNHDNKQFFDYFKNMNLKVPDDNPMYYCYICSQVLNVEKLIEEHNQAHNNLNLGYTEGFDEWSQQYNQIKENGGYNNLKIENNTFRYIKNEEHIYDKIKQYDSESTGSSNNICGYNRNHIEKEIFHDMKRKSVSNDYEIENKIFNNVYRRIPDFTNYIGNNSGENSSNNSPKTTSICDSRNNYRIFVNKNSKRNETIFKKGYKSTPFETGQEIYSQNPINLPANSKLLSLLTIKQNTSVNNERIIEAQKCISTKLFYKCTTCFYEVRYGAKLKRHQFASLNGAFKMYNNKLPVCLNNKYYFCKICERSIEYTDLDEHHNQHCMRFAIDAVMRNYKVEGAKRMKLDTLEYDENSNVLHVGNMSGLVGKGFNNFTLH